MPRPRTTSRNTDDSLAPTNPVIGDTINALLMLNGLAFSGNLLAHHHGWVEARFLSESFSADGFCVATAMFGQPDLSSHLVSFVISLLCAVGLFAAVQLGGATINPHAVESTRTSASVLVINGLAHLWFAFHDLSQPQWAEAPYDHLLLEGLGGKGLTFAGLFFIWLVAMRGAAAGRLGEGTTFSLAVLATAGHCVFVPVRFGFYYAQTMLVVPFALGALMVRRPAFYVAQSMIGVPVSIIGWVEAIGCDSALRPLGLSHLLYDAALPLAILAYWLHVKAYYSSHSDAFLLFQNNRRIKQDPFKLFQSRDGTKTD